nr:DUF3299 domain-containing protein [Acanthopleuribacter pedis]
MDTRSGTIGPELKQALAQRVRVPGFVVPLDEVGEIFLLTPHAGACIHGPTPPMNQVIFVKMQHAEARIDPWAWEPIWVTGKLHVQEVDSPFGSAGFQMEGLASESYH